MRVLLAAPENYWEAWAPAISSAAPEVELLRDGAPESFDAVLYAPSYPATGPQLDFTPFKATQIVQSLWAGVERILTNETLTQPLCRMVDPGLTQGMVEYCLGWAMRAHLGMDSYVQDGQWRDQIAPPLVTSRKVTILGMGEIGRAVAECLLSVGFQVTGWSASGRPVPGVTVLGGDRLDQALETAEILICLLPDTENTRDLLDHARLAQLPRGAWIINAGRGTLIDETSLIDLLDAEHIGHAVLDVFRVEPLPADHPFWQHSRVTVTPHIAAHTRAETAAPVVAENLRRAMDGRPLLHLVDRERGY